MERSTAKNIRLAAMCLLILVGCVIALPWQTTNQPASQNVSQSPSATVVIVPVDGGGGGTTAPPAQPDVGVPDQNVTDGDTQVVYDNNGTPTVVADNFTYALNSPALSPTSLSTDVTTTTTAAATVSSPFAPAASVSTSSLTCSLHGAHDPGPRPTGNGGFTVFGSTNSNSKSVLSVGVHDFAQPPDAVGNEGVGQVIANSGPGPGGFWFDSIAVFSQFTSPNGAADPATGNPTIKGLGPAFNADSCFTCHSQPTIGGTSPANNPQL